MWVALLLSCFSLDRCSTVLLLGLRFVLGFFVDLDDLMIFRAHSPVSSPLKRTIRQSSWGIGGHDTYHWFRHSC